MAVGAPGGTRIITCVTQTILNYFEFKLPLYESLALVRFHHQWMPDEISMDSPGPGTSVIADLEKRGHHIKLTENAVPCIIEAVTREDGKLHGVSDPRDSGMSMGL